MPWLLCVTTTASLPKPCFPYLLGAWSEMTEEMADYGNADVGDLGYGNLSKVSKVYV
jgi:hypothetical protein